MAPEGPEDKERSDRQSTGAIIGDIALRQGTALAREALGKRLARAGYTKKDVERIVAGQGFGKRFAAAALVRLATRSVPGALAVGGGLIAKALFDRRRKRRGNAAAVDEAPE